MVVLWYRRPDQFEPFTRYLADKGLTIAARLLVVASLVTVTVVLVLTRFSPLGPSSTAARSINLVLVGATVLMIVIFSTRRTLTRRWSYIFVVYADVGIATAMALYSNPLAALAHGVMFSVIGGYITFFHNARIQSVHLLWASVAMAAVVARTAAVAGYRDYAALAAMTMMVGAAVFVLPLVCQFVFSILGVDALNSQRDPLTGVLNRRGLAGEVRLMLARSFAHPSHLMVAAVDIDRFKAINDEYGHAVGDDVIAKVAQRLTECAGPGAVIARIGGDEFILVDTCDQPSIDRLKSELMWSSITSPDHPDIALSVGIATMAGPFGSINRALASYPVLLRRADRAMYSAKTRGGHCVVSFADSE